MAVRADCFESCFSSNFVSWRSSWWCSACMEDARQRVPQALAAGVQLFFLRLLELALPVPHRVQHDGRFLRGPRAGKHHRPARPARLAAAEPGCESRAAGHVQILQFLHPLGAGFPLHAGPAPAPRHAGVNPAGGDQFLHVPVAELHHRRVSRPPARGEEFLRPRAGRELLPATRRRTHHPRGRFPAPTRTRHGATPRWTCARVSCCS